MFSLDSRFSLDDIDEIQAIVYRPDPRDVIIIVRFKNGDRYYKSDRNSIPKKSKYKYEL